jgi:hypothetical protein
MPWELVVYHYGGPPPRLQKDADKKRQLPLGSLNEVRKHISTVLPGTEWYEDPPLIEMMKAAGNTSWETWDQQMIADASKPKLKSVYRHGNVTFEMFGFEQDGPLCYVLLDVRGCDNPLPLLRALCAPKGWSIAEMGKDGEFLDLDGPHAEKCWNNWQRFLDSAIEAP